MRQWICITQKVMKADWGDHRVALLWLQGNIVISRVFSETDSVINLKVTAVTEHAAAVILVPHNIWIFISFALIALGYTRQTRCFSLIDETLGPRGLSCLLKQILNEHIQSEAELLHWKNPEKTHKDVLVFALISKTNERIEICVLRCYTSPC